MLESLFNKTVGSRACNFIKKRLHRPVETGGKDFLSFISSLTIALHTTPFMLLLLGVETKKKKSFQRSFRSPVNCFPKSSLLLIF